MAENGRDPHDEGNVNPPVDRRYRSRSRSKSRNRSHSPGRRRLRNTQTTSSGQRTQDYKSPDRPRRRISPDSRQKTSDLRHGSDDDSNDRGRSRQRVDESNHETRGQGESGISADTEEDGMDSETLMMQQIMGFGSFGSTKNKKVAGADVSGVSKNKKEEYRQYMNRTGGFNRKLSPPPSDRKKK